MLQRIALCVPLALVASAALAGEGLFSGHCHERHHGTCSATPVIESEKRHCWEVRCKEVCIPAVTFPWEMHHGKGKGFGCDATCKCGKTRCVKYLWLYEYKEDVCKCEWTPSAKCGGKGADFSYELDPQSEVQDDPELPEPPAADLPRSAGRRFRLFPAR